MAVPLEIANTSLFPTGDSEGEPVRPVKDEWKAAGITIELSKHAQDEPHDSELVRTYNTAMERSETCNCAIWML
jgi:hypothetical protein